MPQTKLSGRQVKDADIGREHANTSSANRALIRKILQGADISISFTGVDSGTGDVTINVSFASRGANLVLASPDFVSGIPTFRSLTPNDIPTLTLEKLSDAWTKRAVTVATTSDLAASAWSTANGGTLTGYGPTASLAVTTTLSSTTATTTSTAGIRVGSVISGNANIPGGATVVSITNATTFVMSAAATAAGTSITTTFTNTISALVIDGITPPLNARILVKDQSTLGGISDASGAAKHGIYTLTTLGSASVAWVLTRASDANIISEITSAVVGVDSGTVNGGLHFDTDIKSTDTLNTTAMLWHRIVDTDYTIPVTQGGTGATTLTGVVIGNVTSPMTAIAGTANQLLRRNAVNTAYEFFTPNFETAFTKGNFVEGTGITLSGTLTSRLVGTGDLSVTFNQTYGDDRYLFNRGSLAAISIDSALATGTYLTQSTSPTTGTFPAGVVVNNGHILVNRRAFDTNGIHQVMHIANTGELASRYTTNGGTSWGAWRRMWDSVNLNPQTQLNGTGYVRMTGTTVSYVAGATAATANTVVERDVSGNFAVSAITIGSIQSTGIISVLNGGAAQGIKVGNLVVSNAYANNAPTNGIFVSGQIQSAVATGTAPFIVASTTRVANLNVATSGTADALTTARLINGVSFNGTADIIVPTLYNSTFSRITAPGGGEFVSTPATQTGAIRITLPRGMTGAMLRFTVKIYLYATNQSFEVNVGGYPYSAGNTWANNPFAYIVGNPNLDRRFNVRFGFDGTNAVVYIGELNSSWSYPQVFITDFQRGFSDQTSLWANNWSIGFEATAFQNITATISNAQVGYAVSTNTINAGVLRDGSGNFSANIITATLNGSANFVSNAITFNNGGAGGGSGTAYNGASAVTISYNTIGAPSTTGVGASGTWGINITGNATTSTTATNWAGAGTYNGSASIASPTVMMTWNAGWGWGYSDQSQVRTFLGLGSNAYTSTAFLPLAGGTMTGGINMGLNDITNTNSVFARYGEFNNPGGASGYFQANGSTTYGLQAIGVGAASRTIFLAGHSGYSNGFTVEYNHSTPAMVYTMRNGSLTISGGNLVASGTLSAGSNSSALIYGGTALIINRNTAYTQIYRPDGTTGIFLGDADAGNYSDNTNHYFRSRDTSTTFLTLTAATATFTSSVNITNSTASTSTTTGSLRTAGGLGVVGAGHFGGNVSVTNGNGGSIVLWSQYSGSPAHPGIAVTNNSAVLTFSHNSNGGATLTTGTMTASGFIRTGSSDSYFLLGGGGHVLASTYATSASLGSYLPLSGGTLTGQLDGTTAQFRGDGAGGDTISYAPFGVTRAINSGNNMSYIAMTKSATLVWAMGIGASNEFIIGGPVATTQVITTPLFSIQGGTGHVTSVGAVRAGNFHDANGAFNVNLGSGSGPGGTGGEGRGLVAGYSGGGYAGIGYNIRHTTTSNTWIAPWSDTVSYLDFTNGITVRYAPSGTVGRTLTTGLAQVFRVDGPTGNAFVSGSLSVGGFLFTGLTGNYYAIYNPGGGVSIHLGNASDPGTYFSNTTHIFRSRDASTQFVTINSTEINSSVVINVTNTTASTSTTTGALKVAGGGGFVGAVYAASFNGYTFNQNLNTTNNVTFNTVVGTNGGSDSDIMLKNIISRDFYGNANAQIAKFTWKDAQFGIRPKYGYIAQEVEMWLPEAVFIPDGKTTKAVDYTQVHTVLIDDNTKRIKELEARVKHLESQLNLN